MYRTGIPGWNALTMGPAAIVEEVIARGCEDAGAAFRPGSNGAPFASAGAEKYIVCNADEGDSGTYADRMIMEGDPFVLIEGMTIAALAVGASRATSICDPSIRMHCWRCSRRRAHAAVILATPWRAAASRSIWK
jgi:formate dehydrogenase iron-sulfur subunit